jgi:hypothetical protein
VRRLGVYGDNALTKKAGNVQAADFLIGGICAHFSRSFDKAFEVRSRSELAAIFGPQEYSSQYGWDAANGFFDNAVNVPAKLYVSSHVGYTGSAVDGVQASQNVPDSNGTPQNILIVSAGYQNNKEYGISGNRTGITLELGSRFETTCAVTATALLLKVVLASVAGIEVGDIIKFVCTGTGVGTVFLKCTGVNELTKEVSFASAIGSVFPASGDAVTVPGFKIHTWRKSVSGNVTEVDPDLGKTWLTTEPEVTDYYAPNVFASSSWITVSVGATTSPLATKFPAAIAAIAYPTNGAAGTTATTAAHWDRALHTFDGLPVRVLINPETTLAAIHSAGEVYCKARGDSPKWLAVAPQSQTKAQLTAIGNNWQRADDVMMAFGAQWLEVEDPFSSSGLASPRQVPNVGHLMGAIFRTISTLGIHYIPTKTVPVLGATGVVGNQFLNDDDRTDLAGAGVNCVQKLQGYGIVLRNLFTLSTDSVFMFWNGIMMRDFIKASAVDSLQGSENTPNSIGRIKEDRQAIYNFGLKLWRQGSTGSVPEGETFAQWQNDDGSLTTFDDHFEVEGDIVNNPLDRVQAGERNLMAHFTFPTPGGSIKISVGIMLRG